MTREEAIYCLKSYQPDAPDDMCQKCKYYKSVNLASNICTCISSKARDMAIQALSQEPSRDIKEISEIMKCDADAETKCKMISNILTAKPHYFEKQEPCDYTGNEFFNFDAPIVKKSMEQDAISREDVINLKWQGEASEEFLKGYANAIEDARVLPSVMQKSGKWIPVSERLPEDEQEVLITYKINVKHHVWSAIWDELHCRFYDKKYRNYISVDSVVAWMPLPKPYEPQESEKIKCKSTKCENCINHNYCDYEPVDKNKFYREYVNHNG